MESHYGPNDSSNLRYHMLGLNFHLIPVFLSKSNCFDFYPNGRQFPEGRPQPESIRLAPRAAESHISAWALWADSPREAAAGREVVFTSLPGPQEVEAIALAADTSTVVEPAGK